MLPNLTFQYDRKAIAFKDGKIGINEMMPPNSIQQHLYFIHVPDPNTHHPNDEIKQRDWVIGGNIERENHYIRQCSDLETVEHHNKLIAVRKQANDNGRPFPPNIVFAKIIATTDSSLGLPGIPESFIKEYVAANGAIDEVALQLIGVGQISTASGEWEENKKILRLTMKSEVIILK